MASVNKFYCVGGITRDAEVRQIGQTSVAKFGVATTEKWRKQDGTPGEETTYHDIELWGNPNVYQFLTKGQLIYVEGQYKCNEWTAQDGTKRRSMYVKAFTIQLLGTKGGNQQQAPASPVAQRQARPAPPQAPAYSAPPQAPTYNNPPQPPANAGRPPFGNPADDDLPF